jgi:dihydrofolate reductase
VRQVIFGGAMSLDGYIAGPRGEYDWIVMDPDIDFSEGARRFDTYLIGRKTYEAMRRMGSDGASAHGIENIVFSRTLAPADHPAITVKTDAVREVTGLRQRPGKDIALFGGGELFRSLLEAGLVDGIEMALIPVLLGAGIPLLPSPAMRTTLTLRGHRIYSKTGTVSLQYDIQRARS